MHLTFHGAAGTVTGSQHLLSVNGTRLLLDCGLYQGARAEAAFRNRNFPFPPAEVAAVVLSHAHIDHSGNLPNLARQGFAGPIHATHATVDLCDYMLRDSGHIQEVDAEYLNYRAQKKGEPAEHQPLYTEADARATLPLFAEQGYERPFPVAPGVTATFYDAGHMLGSASLILDVEEAGRHVRLAFSGDLGRRGMPLLRDPVLLADVDYLILESTYGGKTHHPHNEAQAEFKALVKQTVARRGKVVIPSFAVGRAQELVYELSQLIHTGEIPALPVYVDSPLASQTATIFWGHRSLLDAEAQAFMEANPSNDLFGFEGLRYVQSAEESKTLNGQAGPMVIISASGMCENGRIRHHLCYTLSDPRNTILIVSWQAPETLGRRLADRAKEVKIFGDTYKVKAQVATINGYSGHAGQDLLVEFAAVLKPRLKGVFLVHGEPAAATALQAALAEAGVAGVHIPTLHERVEL
ncbi:MAG: MBL fold metallo-hydrolase [Anaerolineales bacterium]|nr:MBL fold metallo-hydrolase [Anaerolineales bacterium]